MKFLTEKFSWMIENPTGPLVIPKELLSMDSADSAFCNLSKYCSDEKNDEFCGSPLGDEMREQYCIRYREIKKSIIQGAEEILRNWAPEIEGKDSQEIRDFKSASCTNRLIRENRRGYAFVKTPSSHGGRLS